MLPRELSNRFGKIVLMPEMQEKDYHEIALEAEGNLPEAMQEIFREEVATRIQEAIVAKKRFLVLSKMHSRLFFLNCPIPRHRNT